MPRMLLIICVSLLCGALAFGQNLPSSKATAQVNSMVKCTMSTDTNDDNEFTLPKSCVDIFSGQAVEADTAGWITIMKKPLKVSSSQSIFLSTSLVTGLYTQTRTKTTTPTTVDTYNSSTATAMGGVYLRAVVVDPATKKEVAVGAPLNLCTADENGQVPYGCVDPIGNKEWGVILNSRIQTLTQSLSNCVVNVTVGGVPGTGSCTFTSIIDLILNTTSAHSFNFVFENLGATNGSGVYEIQVKAAVASSANVVGSGSAVGAAVFGLGSMTAEKVRLVHDFEF